MSATPSSSVPSTNKERTPISSDIRHRRLYRFDAERGAPRFITFATSLQKAKAVS